MAEGLAPVGPSAAWGLAGEEAARIAATLAGKTGHTDPFVAAVLATRMPIVVSDPRQADNPVVFCNDAFCVLTGYDRAEVVGRNCRFLQGPQTDPAALRLLRTAVREATTIEIDIRNHRKDGTPFWNRLLLGPVRDSSGALAYFYASQVDVTLERERLVDLESDKASLTAALGDRQRLQEEGAARLRFATEAGRLGIWSLDLVSRSLSSSRRFRRIFGRDPERAFSLSEMRQAIHPEDRERVEAAVAASLADGTDYGVEYRIVRPDGSLGWVEMRAEVEAARDGTPLRMAGISLEISQRKRFELRAAAMAAFDKQLLVREDPGELVFAAAEALGRTLGISRVGYGTVDLAAGTIAIEQDWSTLGTAPLRGVMRFRDYGCYIDELRRGETVVVADSAHDPRTRASAAALAAIGASSFINMPLPGHEGLVALLYLNHATPREWSGDDLDFIREVAHRTHMAVERRRAEQELRRRAGEFEALVENVSQLAWMAEPDGQVFWYNRRWYAYTGTDLAAMQGGGWRDVHHPDHVEAIAGELAAHWALGAAWEGIYSLRGADGRFRPFLTRAEPIRDDAGRLVRWFGTNTDIAAQLEAEQRLRELNDTLEQRVAAEVAERLCAEEQLRQSQKMEAVGQLTGGLAHDFNNLLTGITGSMELLRTRIAQGRTAELERYLLAAEGAARRAAALTHRLLAFSRRQTLSPRATDVDRLVAGMEELVRRTVGPAIEVGLVASPGLWSTLVDQSQLENALLNLCINARDAMPHGGRITVETGNRRIDAAGARDDLPPGDYVSLAVSDTGIGMTPEVVAKAFDPFFTTKPLGEGTGLGLSMIYGFTQQSGGQARIHSMPGHGTTVRLYLPRFLGENEAVEAATLPEVAPRAIPGATVVVVDDEATVRMLVAEVLGDLGYRTLEAGDGAEGLRLLEATGRVDLLITDVGLPGGLNGRQVADAARQLRPALKVLFITGYAENAVVGHGHLDPGMHILTKPFTLETLGARVKELVG